MTTAEEFTTQTRPCKDQRIAKFAGTVLGLSALLWAVLLLGDSGGFESLPLPWQVAVHGLSLLSAAAIYVYCRQMAHRTSAAGLMCFVAIAFLFADVALGFNYSPYVGVAVMAWAASARRPFLTGAGVVAIGAAMAARFDHSLATVVVAASGLAILAAAMWRPVVANQCQRACTDSAGFGSGTKHPHTRPDHNSANP